MNRQLFGAWGEELSDDELAAALAYVGLSHRYPPYPVTADDLLRDRVPGTSPLLPLAGWYHGIKRNAYPGQDYLGWAAAWQQLTPPVDFENIFTLPATFPRLEVDARHLPAADLFDLLSVLARAVRHRGSVYARADEPRGDVYWNWPLRVGFLDDPAGDALRGSLARLLAAKATDWLSWYIRLLTPEETRASGCQVLLLPTDLRAAMAGVCASGGVRAACVLVLGGAAETSARSAALLAALRAETAAEGVGLVEHSEAILRQAYGRFWQPGTRSDLWASWFYEVVRQLSHNRALNDALFEVWRLIGRPDPAPRLVASRRLIEDTPIGRRLGRLVAQLDDPSLDGRAVEIGPETARHLGMPPGQVEFGELAAHISPPDTWRFDHEVDAGRATLELLEATRGSRRRVPRPPRWVQARVYAVATADRERHRERQQVAAFRPGVRHVVEVFVGPREAGAIGPPPDAPPLPEGELPDRDVTLTVVLVESDPAREPQVASVRLSREGRSTDCRFALTVAERAETVEARIVVLYRNRVLQTSVLRGPVGGEGEITITPEAVVRDRLDNLGARAVFDAAVVLNHAAGGVKGGIAARGDRVTRFRLPRDIEAAADWFDQKIEKVAKSPRLYPAGLTGKNVDLLREMAQQGSLLFRAFRELVPPGTDLAALDRVQVVTVDPNTRLPIEFFYDRPAPLPKAKLCPHADAALEAGRCDQACRQDETIVCPLGFWGLSKVLERHQHQPGEEEARNELREADPVDGRDRLAIRGKALLAVSDKVNAVLKTGLTDVHTAVRQIDPAVGSWITDWDVWAAAVSDDRTPPARLLVVMPHVLQAGQPTMEIGATSQLLAANVAAKHVRLPADRQPAPVVVLLGCQTGKAAFPFSSLIGPFRRGGAAVVICTGSSIVGEHAVPVARALLAALNAAAVAPQERSLGDVLCGVRRAMVRAGLPMVFTVLAFGDSDWRIGGSPPAAKARSKKKGGATARGPARTGGVYVTP